MIAVQQIAELEMSAASAMVADGSHVLVVADDENYLDRYSLASGERFARIDLIERALPLDGPSRKAAKADFEALTRLPDDRLLVLGSGSTLNRQTGVLLLAPDRLDGPPRAPRAVDLAPLYGALRERFVQLNIEGAAVVGRALRLLTRGCAGRDNAVIDLELDALLRALDAHEPLRPELVRDVHVVDLGMLDGVPLSFTDASPMSSAPTRLAFAATAEQTDNPYDDGPCVGSVVGALEADGRVAFVERVEGRHKIEGLAVTAAGLVMVADPDDRSRRAPLLVASSSAFGNA